MVFYIFGNTPKMTRKMPQFEFEEGDLEISFTYFYFLGHQISLNKNTIHRLVYKEINEVIPQDRWSIEVAHNLRNKFVKEVVIDYFHLNPKAIFGDGEKFSNEFSEFSFFEDEKGEYTETEIKGSDVKEFKFKIGCRVLGKSDDNSRNPIFQPGAIECFLLKNGHLTVTLRFVNSNTIPSYDAVALIRQPDLVKVIPEIEKIGVLVKKSECLMNFIEESIHKILVSNKVEKIKSSNMYENELVPVSFGIRGDHDEDGLRSIPYVGTTFGFRNANSDDIEALDMSIKRFAISAARATPAFLNSFTNPAPYLETGNRNVYTPGDSIVYIAKRGWCVFDAGVQDREVFYRNVVESTNLAILFTFSTQRTWYQYYRYIKDTGKSYFCILNLSVMRLVETSKKEKMQPAESSKKSKFTKFKESFSCFWKENPDLNNCQAAITEATGFIAKARILAPSSRMSQLFEAHMMSHTARAAVRRCEYICHLVEIEDAASRTIVNYANSLKIAANHFQSEARTLSEMSLKIGVTSFLFAALTYFTTVILKLILNVILAIFPEMFKGNKIIQLLFQIVQ